MTWNSGCDLAGLLDSVRDSEFAGELVTVVSDNASSDDTIAVARATLPGVVVRENGRNAGYAGGINAGIEVAGDCDAYLILNADIRLDPDAVDRLYGAMVAKGAGITVPRLLGVDGALRHSLRNRPTVARVWGESVLGGTITSRLPLLGEVEGRPEEYVTARTADWATGAAMMIGRECLEAVGAWDESFFLYSEETDFALRAKDAGFALWYEPAAIVMHHEGESNTSPALYALLVRNRVRLFRSRHHALPSALFAAGLFAGELVRMRHATHRAAVSALIGNDAVVAQPDS